MPEQDIDQIERALREIRDAYAAKLPGRLGEIGAALSQCMQAPDDTAAWELLLNRLHGVAGSAGSFGFAELGFRATELEMRLNGFLREAPPRDVAPVAAAITRMLEWATGQLQPALPAAEPGTGTVQAPRLVYLVQDHAETELAAQLRDFGYEVETLARPDQLQARLRMRAPAAVLVDLAFPAGVLAGAAELMRIRQQPDARAFVSVFISSRSNFEARLAMVRAGADSFFSRPLDMLALVDRLDALISRNEVPAYRILVVDDDRDSAELHAAVLRAAGMEVRVLDRAAEVMEALGEYRPELVLMDVYMPECDGTELARLIRQDGRYLDVPIVFLSSEDDLGRQLNAIESGADDFLTKPIAPAHLVSALSSRAGRYRILRSLIMRDSLTGLLNHSALKEQLTRETVRSARSAAPLALAMLDVDHFKRINDSHGHPVGDQVIRALARLLQQRLRRGDIIGRYGGEEFAVIMPGTTAAAAGKVIEGVRLSFGQLRHHAEHQDFSASLSAGVSEARRGDDVDDLLRRADAALYQAKRQGRDRVVSD